MMPAHVLGILLCVTALGLFAAVFVLVASGAAEQEAHDRANLLAEQVRKTRAELAEAHTNYVRMGLERDLALQSVQQLLDEQAAGWRRKPLPMPGDVDQALVDPFDQITSDLNINWPDAGGTR